MKGFVDDIEELTEENSKFRQVLYTAKKMQLVVMALRSPSCAEPTNANALGIFHVIRLSSSSSRGIHPE